jgi:hypothetical protein
MSEKQKIINAFKNLDFNNLDSLLDDNRSYMDVSKRKFLETLEKEIKQHEGLNSYETIEEGICNSCNKGCKAYKFKAKNQPSLNLFFEENNGFINDIFICNDLKVKSSNEGDSSISFMFYEDEKADFSPSLNYLMNLQRIEKAIDEFKKLEILGLVPIKEVVYWFDNKMNVLEKELELDNIFSPIMHKEYFAIEALYNKVSSLVESYKKIDVAKTALKKYNEIESDDEESIVKWLIESEYNSFGLLEKTENWKNTGILILETEITNLVLDCSDFLVPFLCGDIYWKHFFEIMTKYEPTKEHYDQHGGSIEYSLETYLKLHNKYLDLF